MYLYSNCYFDLYADDTTVHDNDSDVSNIESHLQCDFRKAISWSIPNKMKIHYDKTSCMLVRTRQQINTTRKLVIHIDDTHIQNEAEQKNARYQYR